MRINNNVCFLHKQGSKDIEERSPEKEKRKSKVRGDERKERKMNRKRVSVHKFNRKLCYLWCIFINNPYNRWKWYFFVYSFHVAIKCDSLVIVFVQICQRNTNFPTKLLIRQTLRFELTFDQKCKSIEAVLISMCQSVHVKRGLSFVWMWNELPSGVFPERYRFVDNGAKRVLLKSLHTQFIWHCKWFQTINWPRSVRWLGP